MAGRARLASTARRGRGAEREGRAGGGPLRRADGPHRDLRRSRRRPAQGDGVAGRRRRPACSPTPVWSVLLATRSPRSRPEILAVPREDLAGDDSRVSRDHVDPRAHRCSIAAGIFTSSGLHDEKMVSLGQAVGRSGPRAEQPGLRDRTQRGAARGAAWTKPSRRRARLGALEADRGAARRHRCGCARRASPRARHGVLSPIQQAEREDAIADWLADHGVDTAVAGPLAETAVTLDALDRIAAAVSGPPLGRGAPMGGRRMLGSRASPRRFRRPRRGSPAWSPAIKGFTHMDQATVAEPVDLTSSLGNTVAVLKSKARAKSVAVTVNVRAGPPARPRLRRRAQPDLGESDRQRARCRARRPAGSR